MDMGKSITVFWDEGKLGQFSNAFLLAPVLVAVLPSVPYRLNALLGILFLKSISDSPSKMKLSELKDNFICREATRVSLNETLLSYS